MQRALAYAEKHFDEFVLQLEDLLRIPSVSTDAEYSDDVRRAAEWLVADLIRLGVQSAEIYETAGHPIVYAEHIVDEKKPTILVYGHYDVQPPDPLELWNSPPFEPVRNNGTIYARGACDDKGQMFMHVKSLESYLMSSDPLPVNVKLIIEGEEENGSANLTSFVEDNKERLTADVVVISDTAMFAEGVPSITSGLRGLAYVEVTLTGPDRDLHSGVYGGGVENPINALCRIINGLHDDHHRVTVPGFYDDALPLTDEERKMFAELPFNEAAWMKSIGVGAVRVEDGYSVLEAITARPSLDVNGIWGGYQGPGAKTVLPSSASAKISVRLIPNQNSSDISKKIEAYFESNTPATMQLEFKHLHGGKPVLVDTNSRAMRAAAKAMEEVYNRAPYFTREGGTIPVVADFKEILGLDTVLMGFGLNSDAIHSPNEHFGLNRFGEGIRSIIRFMEHFGQGDSV